MIAACVRLARRAWRFEKNSWISLVRWTFRRPRVPTGAVAFGYVRPVLPVLISLIAVSAIEIPVLDLVLRRWPVPRTIALVVGGWGLFLMLGLLASLVTRPHAVGLTLLIRYGAGFALELGWHQITRLGHRARLHAETATFQLTGDPPDQTLLVVAQSETNVEVALREPVTVPLPTGPVSVSRVRFWADDPAALVALARGRLDGVPSSQFLSDTPPEPGRT